MTGMFTTSSLGTPLFVVDRDWLAQHGLSVAILKGGAPTPESTLPSGKSEVLELLRLGGNDVAVRPECDTGYGAEAWASSLDEFWSLMRQTASDFVAWFERGNLFLIVADTEIHAVAGPPETLDRLIGIDSASYRADLAAWMDDLSKYEIDHRIANDLIAYYSPVLISAVPEVRRST